MATDPSRWWQPALDARPEDRLALEAAAGRQQRFAQLDALAARLLATALAGRRVASVVRGTGPEAADSVKVLRLTARQKSWCAEAFGVQEQQRRGAWYLPQKMSLKAGAVNLPHLVRERPAHAMTLAADDSAGISLVDGSADAVLLWSVLVPLFDTLTEPIRVRAAGPAKTIDDQRRLWSGIEERYRLLGVADEALEAFRFGGGWHRLDRPGQQRARLRLLDALTAVDPLQLVTRHRSLCMQALMAGFAKKAAKTGTALARRVLTRPLQPVASGYFAGDWLAVLDYLQAPPHPDEEVITALPEPRLYVGMSAQAAGMAAEAGIPEEEIHAMLAAFLGGPTSLSPVEERVAALREWWTAFDHAHAVQRPGMRSLWGLVDDGIMGFGPDEHGFTQQLYRQVLPASVNERVDRLWQSVTLQRHARSIVSNPQHHQLMAETLGPALEFWHGVALTAWFVCEGPYSRAPLSGVADYYSRPLTALRDAGCPVPASLFEELRTAERHLRPEESIVRDRRELPVDTAAGSFSLTMSYSSGSRREGFERVRDIVTRHRRAWADQYLGTYLEQRWRTALEDVARAHHRHVASMGRPPTLIQFAQFATTAANQWTGGDLGALYTAIGEPAPAHQERPARLLPEGDGHDFARRVYAALGGITVDDDLHANQPEEARRQWQLSRLAVESLRYVQLHEALGQPPTFKQFGSARLALAWPGGEAEGWPIFQHTLAALTDTALPASAPAAEAAEDAPGPPESSKHLLAKGANAPLHTESVVVRLITTGAPIDVCAVLLTSHGKVRSDADLVFYNHPHHDGVRTSGDTVTADLSRVPDDVHTVAVIVSIDLEAQPTAVFDQHSTWRAETTQPSGTTLSFEPAPFTSGETVSIVVEIYRHAAGWKVRAVGQGYNTGLAGLAADYGINVEP